MTQIVKKRCGRDGGSPPRGIVYGAIALISFAVVASSFVEVSGVGSVRMIETRAVETLPLRFEDQSDGSITVRDARSSKIIYRVAPSTNGFIRATMRGLARERKREGAGEDMPFTLTHWTDGTVSLLDPVTGRKIALDAFGPANAQAFAQLFAARSQTR
jgi:putative photosynthetic complex assembly protein